MWTALGIISLLIAIVALICAIIGLVVGRVRKQWGMLKWSSVVFAIASILLVIGSALDYAVEYEDIRGWGMLSIFFTTAAAMALVAIAIGVIIGIARKQWGLLKWSAVIFGIAFLSFIFVPSIDDKEPVLSFDELKASADIIEYREWFRNNEQYESEMLYFKGIVIQVMQDRGDKYNLLILLDEGFSNDTLYLSDYRGQRLLEDDVVEFVGESTGLITYESVGGKTITIPEMKTISLRIVSGN